MVVCCATWLMVIPRVFSRTNTFINSKIRANLVIKAENFVPFGIVLLDEISSIFEDQKEILPTGDGLRRSLPFTIESFYG